MQVMANSISYQLRQAALTAIETTGRPMTIPELEGWISLHNAELFTELANKCSDYIRIILNLTPGNVFIRFKCKVLVSGTNGKTRFFGKGVNNYNPNIWVPVNKITQNFQFTQFNECKSRDDPTQINLSDRKLSIASLFPSRSIPPFEECVSDELFSHSWMILNILHPPCSELWVQLSESSVLLKERLASGISANIALPEIIAAHSFLAHPTTVEEVVHILSYDVNQWIARS
jgi:hypothetical protein